jgi:hypothetical protein
MQTPRFAAQATAYGALIDYSMLSILSMPSITSTHTLVPYIGSARTRT